MDTAQTSRDCYIGLTIGTNYTWDDGTTTDYYKWSATVGIGSYFIMDRSDDYKWIETKMPIVCF